MEMDRLSELPDCLLLCILRRLGLKKAAQTAVFSKRWRFVWMNWPFSFCEWSNDTEQIRRFVAGVDTVLAYPRDPPLHRLHISFYYNETFASDVNRWFYFAAKNKVKSLSLRLQQQYITYFLRPPQPPHTLPQIIYTNSALTSLFLERCTIPPPQTAVDWRCLRWLYLWCVKSSQQAIHEIVSGCPLLETLGFTYCDGIKRLEIGWRSFRDLSVTINDGADLEEISAPYMRDLIIVVFFGRSRKKLRLENVQSLESATISLYTKDWDDISVDERSYTTELFKDLRHVEVLDLQCTEVIAMMRRNEWRLPQSRVKCLKMRAASDAQSICGVLAMLESSPYVEELFISIYGERKKNCIDCRPFKGDDLNCDLLHLKTIKFKDFGSSDLCGQPISILAQILFKRGPVLEKMVICDTHKYLSTEEIDFIKEMLLNYPKSSQNVSVEIHR